MTPSHPLLRLLRGAALFLGLLGTLLRCTRLPSRRGSVLQGFKYQYQYV